MSAPRVSVLMCCFNGERWLPEAIESALAQTAGPLELVFMDNGSTDRSAEIVARYASDARVRYHRQSHTFLPVARNHAVRLARGEFFAVLDTDDVWPRDRLARHLAALEAHPEAALVYGDAEHIDEAGRVFFVRRQPEYPPARVLPRLVAGNFVSLGTALVRASCWRAVGGSDEHLFGADDWDLLLRLAARWPIIHLPVITVGFRYHTANTSRDPRMFEDELRIVTKAERAHPELAPICRRKLADNHYRRAGAHRAAQRWSTAWDDYRAALRLRRSHLRAWVGLARLGLARLRHALPVPRRVW
jgi:glycosyltransferase involved in cell wall biosynthesis